MIIAKLQGGLGNQMFQYAAARKLSVKYGVDLLLDHSYLERNSQDRYGFTARNFELEVFRITANRFSPEMVDKFFDAKEVEHIELYNEKPVSYDAFFKKVSDCAYINGYFQSYRYFEDIRQILSVDFSFNHNPEIVLNSSTISQIRNANAVAIHIRRGDYVSQSNIHNLYYILPLSYYQKAINIVLEKQPNLEFFVFSDDIRWAEQNLVHSKAKLHFVLKNNSPNWLDMYLMSICKHNIIANSTFSWWAAWLNNNEDKIVIAPKKWFQQPREGIKLRDLCPSEWIKM